MSMKNSLLRPRLILTNYVHERHQKTMNEPMFYRHTPNSPQVHKLQSLARKRSSLARPVRVYDSSVQSNSVNECPIKAFEDYTDNQANQIEANAYYTGGVPFDENSDSDSGWPIRFRLEEMLELTLSRSKKINVMRKTRKRKKVTFTKKQTYFRDTEKLLKVLSINNVDQHYRYNVKRCSIM